MNTDTMTELKQLLHKLTAGGGVHGNPYCDPDVKRALQHVADAQGIRSYLDARLVEPNQEAKPKVDPAGRFEEALDAFVRVCQEVSDFYMSKNFPTLNKARIVVEPGGRAYVRIVRMESQNSVHAFVRRSDGAILYPAGWKKPYIGKTEATTVRGNIFAEDGGRGCMGPHGVKTIR